MGEWDWAIHLLEEWIDAENESIGSRIEITTDLAMFDVLRGLDASARIASAESMLVGLSDLQFVSYRQQAMAWAAFAEGRMGEAQTAASDAVDTTSYFGPMVLPVGARAAIWDGDAVAARGFLDRLIADRSRGAALSADILTIRAGIAALERRPADALASYREALRAWQGLGLVWDEALCAIDMVTVLDPGEPEVRAAADGAGAILTRLGAKPMLARLDAALSIPSDSARRMGGTAVDATSPTAVSGG